MIGHATLRASSAQETSDHPGVVQCFPNGDQIGRITTNGTINQYPLTTSKSGSSAITSGPDGALWFTETASGKIGRISTTGAVTEYPTSMTNNEPSGITTGPDGALWFTETFGSKIARFATAPLMVVESGTGVGQVTSGPSGINCSQSNNQCAASFIAGTPVTLMATAAAGSGFTGWSGGGCGGTAPCQVTVSGALTVTANFSPLPSYTLSIAPAGSGSGTVTSSPSGIACGTTCNASYLSGTQVTLSATAATGSTFAGWSGGGCSGIQSCTVTLGGNTTVNATFIEDTTTSIALLAAVLPESRSVQVGGTATAFATIANAGPGTATTCTIAPQTVLPASFAFQTTDPATNAVTGTPNTPADISQGGSQSFVFAFTPNAAFAPTNVLLTFGCANAAPAAPVVGLNTLNLSASATPVPDVVALAGSTDPGYVDVPGATGTGAFAVATVNVGSAAQITASADSGTANVPATILICQSNPANGACLSPPAANTTTTINTGDTPTYSIFVQGSAAIPDLPGINRVFVRFTDAGGVLRGQTSVAVRTQ